MLIWFLKHHMCIIIYLVIVCILFIFRDLIYSNLSCSLLSKHVVAEDAIVYSILFGVFCSNKFFEIIEEVFLHDTSFVFGSDVSSCVVVLGVVLILWMCILGMVVGALVGILHCLCACSCRASKRLRLILRVTLWVIFKRDGLWV